MLRPTSLFRKYIIHALSVLMALIVGFSTLDLAWILIQDLITPPTFFLEPSEILDLFGLFMLVLIGLELLETIQIYSAEHVIHVESVMMVAIIAIARKVIILDIKELPFQTLLGISSVLVALGAGYFLFKRARSSYFVAGIDDRKCKVRLTTE